MEFSIRKAHPGDAAEIAELHHLVWPREMVDPNQVNSLLAEESHTAYLAFDPLGLVGYADGFQTRAQDQAPRWELDLLAVHPRARRRGIAIALIKEQISGARQNEIDQIRALVKLNNRGAHRAFASAGFEPSPSVLHLYTAAIDENWDPKLPSACHLVDVTTFTYSGVWLEGCLDSETILSVLEAQAAESPRMLGVLIDPHQVDPDASERMVRLTFGGAHQWYYRTP